MKSFKLEDKLLKEIACITMGQSPKSEYYNAEKDGMPFLQGRKTFGEKYHSIDTWTTKSLRIANKGSILFSVRAPVGDINIATQKLCIGRGLSSIEGKHGNTEFLYYLLKNLSKSVSSQSNGTVFDSINKTQLENLKVKVPELKVQHEIGRLLKSLDDKIVINSLIIENLELLSQTLFKKWFVDFDFQNEEGFLYKSSGGEFYESELGLIPKGWEVHSLTEIAKYKNGLAMQKHRPQENEKSLPVLKIKELNEGTINNNSDICSENINEEVKVYNGDVIFSWSGTLLVKLWTGGDAGLNQHLFKVTSSKFPKWFYYLWTKHHLNNFISIAKDKATTMGHINRSHLEKSLVTVPNESHLLLMNELMESLLEEKINIGIENKNLTKLRDSLLPKLLSGEIEVPIEAESILS